MVNPSSNDETIEEPQKNEGPAEVLLRLTANAGFLRSTDGRFYAQVSVGGRREIYTLKSAAFRDWLIDGYFRDRRELPSDWSMRRVLAALEATARFEGGTPSIFVRVGHDGNSNGNGNGIGSACYLDLADSGGQAVEIGPGGWSVVNNPRIHFRRPDGHLPLPMPGREGSIDLLRAYVNLTDRDFRLLIVWMAAALRPVGPYPILALYGQHGSTKSTLAKVVRLLIDPQAGPPLAEPRNTRALMVTAVNGWVLAYDNISVIPRWLSDGLCLLATGGALADHASFTKGERTVIHAQRPVILSGIEEFIRRDDLSDRSVVLDLPPILPSRRRLEHEFWASFHQDYPRILGGLLDAVAGGLRALPSVRLTELPRMADFATFAEAVGRKLGWPAGTALSEYNENRREATMNQLEDSPVAAVLLDLGPDYLNDWSGTPTELLSELTALAGKHADSPRWPKSPQWLTIELRRIAPLLGIHGIFVHSTRGKYGRVLSITRDRKVAEKNGAMRELIADDPLGLERDTPEKWPQAQ
ncbi:MAG: hypothetical protein ACHRXM_07140 [Isosphaerales bacterium]